MKLRALILALLSTCAIAQSPGPNDAPPILTSQISQPVYTLNLAPVTQASVSLVGNPGPQAYYYWIVTNYTLGATSPAGPFLFPNAPNTLSNTNYVQITPQYLPGIVSVDLLRTKTPTPPSGACNCAVATAVTSGTINDQSNTRLSYTVAPINVNAFTMTLQNEVVGAGSTHEILRQNGTLVCDLSIGCNGGLSGGGTGGFLPLWTGSGSVTALGTSHIADTGSTISLSESLTLATLAGGGTQCVQISNTGVVSGTGAVCGGGGGGVNNGTVTFFANYASTSTVGSSPNFSETLGSTRAASGLSYIGDLGLTTNAVDNVRLITPTNYVWSQSIAQALTANTPATVTLSPCPLGIWGANAITYVSINSGAEFDQLTGGGNCVTGAASGTVTFVPQNNYASFTIGTATNGIQEGYNVACGSASAGACKSNWAMKLAPTNPPATSFYTVSAPVSIPLSIGDLDLTGVSIDCESRQGACFYFTSGEILVHGARVGTKTQIQAAAITQTACTASTGAITTSLNPPVGSVVDIQSTDNPFYWGRYRVATTSGSQFTYTNLANGTAISCPGGALSAASTPGGVAIDRTFIEANGNGLHLSDIYYDLPAWDPNGYLLNSLVVVDNDQDFRADKITLAFDAGSFNSCTANYCPQVIYAPGGAGLDPVGSVSHLAFSMDCSVNGIKWLAGQGLHIGEFSILQSPAEYAIAAGPMRGSSGQTVSDGTYMEPGGCSNPLYTAAGFSFPANQALAGINQLGSALHIRTENAGAAPSIVGVTPQFSIGGGTFYQYWLIICDGSNCTLPLQFGQANPTSSASYQIGWPRYGSQTGSTVTYWALKTTGLGGGSNAPAPFGTGNYSLTSTAIAQCSTMICTMNDSTSTTLQSYTVGITPGLVPYLWNWPGGVILSAGAVVYSDSGVPTTNPSPIIVTSNSIPSVYAERQDLPTSGAFVSALGNTTQAQTGAGISTGGTMLFNGVGAGNSPLAAGRKGRLIFEPNPAALETVTSSHIITLNDSNGAKTVADPDHRPTADANDVYIGLDNPPVGTGIGLNSQAQLSFGAPAAISNYIGNIGDNVNWGERLTSTSKLFRVNTSVLGNFFALGSVYGVGFPFALVNSVADPFSGSGSLGSNWAMPITSWTKSGGQATGVGPGSGSTNAAYTGAGTIGPAQFASVTFGGYGAPASYVGPAVRVSASANSYYACLSYTNGGTGSQISKPGAILATGPAIPVGDNLLIVVAGSTITCYDEGVPIMTATDSSIVSGYPGLAGSNNVGLVSSFSGGPLSYQSGGTFQFLAQASGSVQCAEFDATGNLLGTGSPCGSGGGGGFTINVNGAGGLTTSANFQNGTAGNNINFSLSGSNIQALVQNTSISNAMLVNASTTVNGQTCTLGSTCTITGVGTVTSVDGTASEGAETAVGGTVAAISTTGTIRGSVAYETKTGNYTLLDTDRGHVILSSDTGADAYTLPTPSGVSFQNGWYVWIKNGSTTSPITLFPAGSTTIDGQASLPVPAHTVALIEVGASNYHTLAMTSVGNNAANLFWASPSGSTGPMSPRSITTLDLPAIPNAGLVNSSLTVNGVTCTLGGTCTVAGSGGISGSGTTNSIPKWTGSAVQGNSALVDTGSAVTSTETVTAPAFITSGAGGGLLGCSQGLAQSPPANGFALQCPEAIASAYEVTVPEVNAAGFWFGTIVATAPSASCTLSGSTIAACATSFSAGSASSSLGYSGAPPCVISGTGTGGTCVFTMSGSYPNKIPTGITVINPGTGYTGTPTAGVPGSGVHNLQFATGLAINSSGALTAITLSSCGAGTYVKADGSGCGTPSGGSGVTSVAATVNGGSSSGALAISGSPITASGTLNLAWTGTNGDVMTFGASSAPTDSGTLLSSLETTAAAQAAFSGHGSCTNQAVTAANANAAPTCTTLTSAYVDSSILSSSTASSTYAPLASPALTGTPTVPTAAAGTSTTQAASTSFVATAAIVTPATTAGISGVFSSGLPLSIIAGSTATPVNNTMYLHRMHLSSAQVIGHSVIDVTTAGTAETMFVCLYNSAGTGTPLWSASGTVNAIAVTAFSAAQYTAAPGDYWVAYGQTGTTAAVVETYNAAAAPVSIINSQGVRVGTSSTSISSGCPTGIGTPTAASTAVAEMILTLEP